MRPPKAQEKFIEPMVRAIVNLVHKGCFNPTDIGKLAKPIKLGKAMEILVKLQLRLLNLIYWGQKLKKNDAYEKSFDTPYLSLAKERPTV